MQTSSSDRPRSILTPEEDRVLRALLRDAERQWPAPERVDDLRRAKSSVDSVVVLVNEPDPQTGRRPQGPRRIGEARVRAALKELSRSFSHLDGLALLAEGRNDEPLVYRIEGKRNRVKWGLSPRGLEYAVARYGRRGDLAELERAIREAVGDPEAKVWTTPPAPARKLGEVHRGAHGFGAHVHTATGGRGVRAKAGLSELDALRALLALSRFETPEIELDSSSASGDFVRGEW